ncbi:MAG: hypothetical protein MZV65_15605 [Chromatiales bacterium]|nr:hypothetical protein [Chromatiales bacterium]
MRLQALLKSFDIAVEQYARVSGTHWYELELTATDNLTLERMHVPLSGGGDVEERLHRPARGPAPRGGPERGPAQPAAGRGPADRGRAAAGGGRTGGDAAGTRLRWLVSRIDQSRPYYLLGEVEMRRWPGAGPDRAARQRGDLQPGQSYRGGILRLHYARAAELGPWLDLVAVRGEVVVQFWLKPGEAAVTLGPGEEQREDRIPEQLRRFL